MSSQKYSFPDFLEGKCTKEAYGRWLQHKARTHRKRDKKRGNEDALIENYKVAIHQAVMQSCGLDAYTGEPLRWDLINKYNNEESKARNRKYKHEFADLPTIHHVGDGLDAPEFRICSWRINDAKHDLSLSDFLIICEKVLQFHRQSVSN